MVLRIFIGLILTALFVKTCEEAEQNEVFAEFSVQSGIILKGQDINFTNMSQYASSYLWDFGDGLMSNAKDPVHHYDKAGDYTVYLHAIAGKDTSSFSALVNIRNKKLTIMTYNIAFSGGAVEELYPMWETDGHGIWNRDRRAEFARIIKEVNPDILALQEAFCWDSYDPQVYLDFADMINMEYHLYPGYEEAEWNGLCIYSKYPIEQIKMLYHQPCAPDQVFNGLYLLGAEVLIDDDSNFDFYSCHMGFHVEGMMDCEMELLSEYFLSRREHRSILLGDMNWRKKQGYINMMNNANLHYIVPSGQIEQMPMDIDQVWISHEISRGSESHDRNTLDEYLPQDIMNMLEDVSDHPPVIALVYI